MARRRSGVLGRRPSSTLVSLTVVRRGREVQRDRRDIEHMCFGRPRNPGIPRVAEHAGCIDPPPATGGPLSGVGRNAGGGCQGVQDAGPVGDLMAMWLSTVVGVTVQCSRTPPSTRTRPRGRSACDDPAIRRTSVRTPGSGSSAVSSCRPSPAPGRHRLVVAAPLTPDPSRCTLPTPPTGRVIMWRRPLRGRRGRPRRVRSTTHRRRVSGTASAACRR